MRFAAQIQHVAALLSQMFLSIFICLTGWSLILPLLLGWTPTVVMSGSMMPNIKVGDILLADPMSPKEVTEVIETGHVLLAEDPAHNGVLVTHRVIEAKNNNTVFITKGDANRKADSTPVRLKSVKGLERVLIPYVGIPVQGLRTGNYLPAGILIGLALLAYLIVRREYRIIGRNENSDSENNDDSGNQSDNKPEIPRKAKSRAKVAGAFIVALLSIFTAGNSNAAFAGMTATPISSFKAASSFSPITGTCLLGVLTPQVFDLTLVPVAGSGLTAQKVKVTVVLDAKKEGFVYSLTLPASIAANKNYKVGLRVLGTSALLATDKTPFTGGSVSGRVSLNPPAPVVAMEFAIYEQSTIEITRWTGILSFGSCKI